MFEFLDAKECVWLIWGESVGQVGQVGRVGRDEWGKDGMGRFLWFLLCMCFVILRG